MAGGKTAGGNGDPDPGQNRADQRRQIQKALRPIQRCPQFSAGITHTLQFFPSRQSRFRPDFERIQHRRIAR